MWTNITKEKRNEYDRIRRLTIKLGCSKSEAKAIIAKNTPPDLKENEVWVLSKVYPFYEVSNLGRVRSIRRGVILKSFLKLGYEHVSISYGGVVKGIKIHRMVALAFIPNPKNKPQVNHIDSIRDNNKVENLEWCTPKENIAHYIKSKSKCEVV